MKALISPTVKVFDPNTGLELGDAVAEVADAEFPVALPLFWVDCQDDVIAGLFYYEPNIGAIIQTPEPPIPEQPLVQGAQTL